MASAIKRRKISDQPTESTAEQIPPWGVLTRDLWREIASHMTNSEINRFYFLNKNLSSIPTLFNHHLMIPSGMAPMAWVDNNLPEKLENRNPVQIIRLLNENKVASFMISYYGTYFSQEMVSALSDNNSCREIKINGNLFYGDVETNKTKINTLLKDALKIIANKNNLEHFKIVVAHRDGNLSLNQDLIISLFKILENHPLKSLKIDIKTDDFIIANLIANHLQNFQKLEHLEVRNLLTLDFWKALTNHPTIKELYFAECKMEEGVSKEEEKMISHAISSLHMLESLEVEDFNKHNDVVKYCITALSNSVPPKLKNFQMRIWNFSGSPDPYISEEVRKKFFRNIANSKSPIRTLAIQDPYIFDFFITAPWEKVRTAIRDEDLYKLNGLTERTKDLFLHLDYKGDLSKIKNLLKSILPNPRKQAQNLENDAMDQDTGFQNKSIQVKLSSQLH